MLLMPVCLLFCRQAAAESTATVSPNAAGAAGPGTLAHHLATNAVARARGFSGSPEDMLLLSNWTYAEYSQTNLHLLTNAAWSTQCWLHGVQGLTATAIGFSNGLGGQGLVTMVSPRHYLCSTHMHPEAYLAAFLDTNSVLYWRKTLQRIDVTNDTSVGILNADLPSSVGFLPVAPANLSDYLPADKTSIIQGIGMNQSMLVFSQPMSFGFAGLVVWNPHLAVPFGLASDWDVAIRGGDSSDPDLLLIGNQLVLVTHTYGTVVGPNYSSQIGAINRAMHFLSGKNHVRTDYQLTPFSLANWPRLH